LAIAAVVSAIVALEAPGTAAADSQQWHLDFLHVSQAQLISQGAGVVVAVIDSGVDGAHPDLAGSVLPGEDLGAVPASSDGRVDLDGHGTGMAGLIAAHGQVLGIAPQAKILPVRVVDDPSDTTGLGRSIGAGIDFAVDHGASVISVSVGEPEGDPTEAEAVKRAIANNVVVVAAAGNRTAGPKTVYPAAYPGVVTVVGVDQQGNHADISVVSPQAVLAAPAVQIYSTNSRFVVGGGYRLGTGTSDAAAIVSGVAALVRSKFPSMSAADVVVRLEATADDKGPPGRDSEYGYGIVDPVKALTARVVTLRRTASARPAGSPSAAPLLIVGLGGLAGVIFVGLVVNRRRRVRNDAGTST
jgi:type VII secretion-associated serine protease mycosin